MLSVSDFHIIRGEYWQRLVVVKDKRTHHLSPCTEATAYLQDADGIQTTLDCTITHEGAILLVMDETETADLVDGSYYLEVSANPYVYSYSAFGGIINPPYPPRTRRVTYGTVEVITVGPADFPITSPEATDSTIPTLDQSGQTLNLKWTEGDAVALAFTAANANWAGTYVAQVRTKRSTSGVLMGTLTVTATYNGTSTDFVLSMSTGNSALIPAGSYYWDLQQVGGTTRLTGAVIVEPQVSS